MTEPTFSQEGLLHIFQHDSGDSLLSLNIELAETEREITQGLMFRRNMKTDQAMLFIFPDEEPRSFWMRNTYLPLDILFLNSQAQIVTIRKNCLPLSNAQIISTQPAQYVLEVMAGICDQYQIQEGDYIVFSRLLNL